jgi:uncharacterized membrane protein (DUF4010 family)
MDAQMAGLATALGVGLLIGAERESRRNEDGPPLVAGVRTFTLISLSGAITAIIGMPAVVAGALFIGLAAVMSYRADHGSGPGLTTEVAMFITFLLGVLAMSEFALSAGLGAGIALILAAQTRLHEFVRKTLSPQELMDGLILLGAVLIVLPLLPDEPLDPWGVFNLQKLWRLVVLVMAINALGYVAQRSLGPRLGLPISGLAGGFISATATIGAMATLARNDESQRNGAIAGALLANLATIIQLAVILALLAPELLHASLYGLGFAGAVAAVSGGLAGWKAWHALEGDERAPRGRAFDMRAALMFVVVVAVILLVSALLADAFGKSGAIAAAAVSGFADAHAPAASVAQLSVAGKLDRDSAMLAIMLALATNSSSKVVLAFVNGGHRFGLIIAVGLLLILAALGAGLWLSHLLALPSA